ncbi:hypothetical protein F4824DRAFT_158892 [Ustulina deusta]|nr:hypothetical protein F4824DRAFT_158892 [Ustulina deusta]
MYLALVAGGAWRPTANHSFCSGRHSQMHCPPLPLLLHPQYDRVQIPPDHAHQLVETTNACPSSGLRCQSKSDHQSSCVRDSTSHIHIPKLTSSTCKSSIVCADERFGIIILTTYRSCFEMSQHSECAVVCAHAKCGLATSAHSSIMRPPTFTMVLRPLFPTSACRLEFMVRCFDSTVRTRISSIAATAFMGTVSQPHFANICNKQSE